MSFRCAIDYVILISTSLQRSNKMLVPKHNLPSQQTCFRPTLPLNPHRHRGAGTKGGFVVSLLVTQCMLCTHLGLALLSGWWWHHQLDQTWTWPAGEKPHWRKHTAQNWGVRSAPLVATQTHETKLDVALNITFPNFKQINIFPPRCSPEFTDPAVFGMQTDLYDYQFPRSHCNRGRHLPSS